eukprot:gnl/Spiro4/27481_TR13673_c0_g1_i1.p1 gnl/Spiro4/27481_TR13673_c0_g1~~gnl/Spiro4/27481_TR13673_c0_g1_i1.p1  ORF type:complete len:317 (+),score=52.90 gnl/Spiro4/27481_TR13673_c0_g1_i1:40-951(+)
MEDAKLQTGLRCSWCSASGASYRCSQCRETVYCNRNCQSLDWRAGHRSRCLPLSQLSDVQIQQRLNAELQDLGVALYSGMDKDACLKPLDIPMDKFREFTIQRLPLNYNFYSNMIKSQSGVEWSDAKQAFMELRLRELLEATLIGLNVSRREKETGRRVMGSPVYWLAQMEQDWPGDDGAEEPDEYVESTQTDTFGHMSNFEFSLRVSNHLRWTVAALKADDPNLPCPLDCTPTLLSCEYLNYDEWCATVASRASLAARQDRHARRLQLRHTRAASASSANSAPATSASTPTSSSAPTSSSSA